MLLLLLLLLSRFKHVWLCATPKMAAHQALTSLGFSKREHWSGLPFPSPMHESGKLSCVRLFATPRTATYQAPLPMGFSRQEYWSGLPLPSIHLYCYYLNWNFIEHFKLLICLNPFLFEYFFHVCFLLLFSHVNWLFMSLIHLYTHSLVHSFI